MIKYGSQTAAAAAAAAAAVAAAHPMSECQCGLNGTQSAPESK